MNIVFIGLGSNLNQPVQQLQLAITHLKALPQSQLIACSRFYENPPLGNVAQPEYVNAVAKITTTFKPHALLKALQKIECKQGRIRKEGTRWQPRTLDLDILLFNQDTIEDGTLTVPHPGLKDRAFVIYPLLEIEKNLILPDGIKLQDLTTDVENNLIVRP